MMNNFVCCLCAAVGDGEEALKEHISVDHLAWIPYQCNYCRSVYLPNETAIAQHFDDTHPNAPSKVTYNFDAFKLAELRRLYEQSVTSICAIKARKSDASNPSAQRVVGDPYSVKFEDGVPLYNAPSNRTSSSSFGGSQPPFSRASTGNSSLTSGNNVGQHKQTSSATSASDAEQLPSTPLVAGGVTATPAPTPLHALPPSSPAGRDSPEKLKRLRREASSRAGSVAQTSEEFGRSLLRRASSSASVHSSKSRRSTPMPTKPVGDTQREIKCNLCENKYITSENSKMKYHVHRYHMSLPMASCRRCDFTIMHEDRSGLRKKHNDKAHPNKPVDFSERDKDDVEREVQAQKRACFQTTEDAAPASSSAKKRKSGGAELTAAPSTKIVKLESTTQSEVETASQKKATNKMNAGGGSTPAAAVAVPSQPPSDTQLTCALCRTTVADGHHEHVWRTHMGGKKAPFECRLCPWKCYHQDLRKARKHVYRTHPGTLETLRDNRNKYGAEFVKNFNAAFVNNTETTPIARSPVKPTNKAPASSTKAVESPAVRAKCRLCPMEVSHNRQKKKIHIWRHHMPDVAMFECRLCDYKLNEQGFERRKQHNTNAHPGQDLSFKDNRSAQVDKVSALMDKAFGADRGDAEDEDGEEKDEDDRSRSSIIEDTTSQPVAL